MKKREFIEQANLLLPPLAFIENEAALMSVNEHKRESLIALLRVNIELPTALKAFDTVFDITVRSHLTPIEVVQLLGGFYKLSEILGPQE
jgi:hypothetical protein